MGIFLTDMISYDEFGSLKFLDFFPMTPLYYDDDVGGTVTIIGYACVAGYGFTSFARIEGETQTGAINLDFSHDCPEVEGNALLARLGLNLVKGASVSEVLRQLGTPHKGQTNPIGFRFCSFTVGEQWRYRISCGFDQVAKLYRVGVARNDLIEKNEQAL
jgi:hypothetical protein